MKKNILIAHQSTIPHYRIGFYNELEKLTNGKWSFKVVFDDDDKRRKRIFKESIDTSKFNFDTEQVKTFFFVKNKFVYQTLFWKALYYDVIILEDALNNLTYPMVVLLGFFGKKIILWGHGKNRRLIKHNFFTRIVEKIRHIQIKNCDAYIAYTVSVRTYLANITDSEKIFIINNTIDIDHNRTIFNRLISLKESIKKNEFLDNQKILLYVGRIQKRKKIDYLIRAFREIKKNNDNIKLIIIGDGDEKLINTLKCTDDVLYYSAIINPEILGKYLVISDLFVLPGTVGLAPIQALCFDLIPVVVASPYHSPEIDYLEDGKNSIILPENTTEKEYANSIISVLSDSKRLNKLRSSAWVSIGHLTEKNMAYNFKQAIDYVLQKK